MGVTLSNGILRQCFRGRELGTPSQGVEAVPIPWVVFQTFGKKVYHIIPGSLPSQDCIPDSTVALQLNKLSPFSKSSDPRLQNGDI